MGVLDALAYGIPVITTPCRRCRTGVASWEGLFDF